MTALTNRQIRLQHLPPARLDSTHFRVVETTCPEVGEQQVLVRTRYVALDAANRAWLRSASYRPGLVAGEVIACASLVEVMESRVAGSPRGNSLTPNTPGGRNRLCWRHSASTASAD